MRFLSTEEVKRLSTAEAARYCNALRSFLVKSVSKTGGHLASNLGIAEISMALVRSFSLPEEKIVYDTGHQSYIHKLLTGRGEDFASLRKLDGISGFPRREESEFDAFGTGHSGTGISAALGFAKASRLAGSENFSVAVIGDGSFTGGMVFEALNNIHPRDRIIIILNDNGMSIGKSVGALKGALNRMRTRGYYRFKDGVQSALESIPLVGKELAVAAKNAKNAVKKSALPMGNLFEQYGLHYFGPADGNDLETVEFLLSEAKKKNGPSILHLCTKKGKGFAEAERDPGRFHGLSPKSCEAKPAGKSFSSVFGTTLCALAEQDERIVAVTAAMTDGVGLRDFAEKFPRRFFDVGIAEEHAVTFAAGLAAAGRRPCFAVYSTFFQRSYDQLLHDAALQKLPVTLCLDRAGISGEDGSTHHGLFDVAMTLPIPQVKLYAPCSEKEMESALRRAISETECPSVIRYPKDHVSTVITEHFPCQKDVEVKLFGEKPSLTVVSYGRITESCLLAAKKVYEEKNISCRVVRFAMLKGFDLALLPSLFHKNERLLFVEEGVERGGFSQDLVCRLATLGLLGEKAPRILALGDTFVPHGSQKELLSRFGLDESAIEKELIRLAST